MQEEHVEIEAQKGQTIVKATSQGLYDPINEQYPGLVFPHNDISVDLTGSYKPSFKKACMGFVGRRHRFKIPSAMD